MTPLPARTHLICQPFLWHNGNAENTTPDSTCPPGGPSSVPGEACGLGKRPHQRARSRCFWKRWSRRPYQFPGPRFGLWGEWRGKG